MLSENRIRKVIQEEIKLTMATNLEPIVEKALVNAFKLLGITTETPHEVQRDFHYLRKQRKTTEETKGNIIRTLISVGIGASVVGGFEAIKSVIQ